eukprot:535616-Pyramimonas_sp.AAC.1
MIKVAMRPQGETGASPRFFLSRRGTISSPSVRVRGNTYASLVATCPQGLLFDGGGGATEFRCSVSLSVGAKTTVDTRRSSQIAPRSCVRGSRLAHSCSTVVA